jgi:hypothetical protein
MKLSDFPPHVQKRIQAALDADAVRPLSPALPQPDHQRQTPRTHPPQASRAHRVVISLIALRRRPLDPDNNAASFKHLQDAIAQTLGLDDGDKRLTWQYQQMHTYGSEGVLVRIELE